MHGRKSKGMQQSKGSNHHHGNDLDGGGTIEAQTGGGAGFGSGRGPSHT